MAVNGTPLNKRLKVLGGAEETDAGTAETVTAALAGTVIYEARLRPTGVFEGMERKPQGHYQGHYQRFKGKQLGELTFRQELRFNDNFVEMLTGAGFLGEALETPTRGVYNWSSDYGDRKTWTFNLWEDGRRKHLYGAACNGLTITGTNGGYVNAEWTWSGIFGDEPTTAAMPTLAPINTEPYRARGVTLTLAGGEIPFASAFTINPGVSAEEVESLVATHGVKHFRVTDPNPTIEIDPEARLAADYDTWTAFLAGTEAAFSLALEDADGNSLTFAAPKTQRIEVGDADRGERLTDPLTLQCNVSSGDDFLTITETTASP